ncbi:MAG: sulfatase-like hydrolase/transferase [Verrucomicrobia bacterium]|jgi:arylsulfatase A-like enzyme|nr:sulfatase-like hydrolase/transferase [Verrucomicrobiota bacterium]
MNKRITTCLAALLCAAALHASAERPNPPRRVNVIFLFADDWGWGDLSCHGHEHYKTPNLDKLASQGTEFTQFTVASGVCSPSRTAVMTGHYPARHSIHQHFAHPAHNRKCGMPDWLDPAAVMLPRLFQEAGYKTAHYGKWHLTNSGCDDAPWPKEYGYDDSGVFNGYGPGIPASDATTYDKTIEFMTKHKDEPFFINVWMHETHTPHFPKKEFLKDYEDLDEQHKVYAAIVAEADHGVGRILQALDELGLADNTLVVFSSDNGPERTGKRSPRDRLSDDGDSILFTYYSVGSSGGLKGGKRSLYEGGIRVPFFVRWPGKVPAGKKNDTTVITAADLLPTFCKAADIELPRGYQPDGEDMLGAFLGKDVSRTKPIFWEWQGARAGNNWPRLAIRDGDWKLVMNHDGSRSELYNIPQDRAEQSNVAQAHPEIVQRLSKKVLAWKQTLPKAPAEHCISKLRK